MYFKYRFPKSKVTELCLSLRCYSVKSGISLPTFKRNLHLPSSALNINLTRQQLEPMFAYCLLTYSSTLKMEAANISETSVTYITLKGSTFQIILFLIAIVVLSQVVNSVHFMIVCLPQNESGLDKHFPKMLP
jgi:hypothetical protein